MKSSVYSFYSKHILTLLMPHPTTSCKERTNSKLLQTLWGSDLVAMGPEVASDDALLVTDALLDELTSDESDGEATEDETTEETLLAGFTFWEHTWTDDYESSDSDSDNEREDGAVSGIKSGVRVQRSEWTLLLQTLRDERISALQELIYTQPHSQFTQQSLNITTQTQSLHSTKVNFNKTTPLRKRKKPRDTKNSLQLHKSLVSFYYRTPTAERVSTHNNLTLLNRLTKTVIVDLIHTFDNAFRIKAQFLIWISNLTQHRHTITNLSSPRKTSNTVRPQWTQFNTLYL